MAAMLRHQLARALVVVVLLAGLIARPVSADTLPALGADLTQTTVSGLSSGAYMAGQFQIAYSQLVIGAGIVAGGPYACAETPGGDLNPFWAVVLAWNLTRAQDDCMEDGWWLWSTVPAPANLLDYAKQLAQAGKIDALSGLTADKVYLFSSSHDDTVHRGVVEAAFAFYEKAGIPAANIEFVKDSRAAHAFLTETEGLTCGTAGPPYLNDCDYDQAKAILEWLYGHLDAARDPPAESFIRFAQSPFLSGLGDAGFSEEGVAYIPAACRSTPGCKVHVVFHGCEQGLAAVGDTFVKGSGFARWAEGNRIILLFPQVTTGALNPNGCWDWWGYTGRNFLERDAPQMLAVRRMLDRLAQAPH